MKENYISRINKLGKYAGIVVNVLKGITIFAMVAVALIYIFVDMFAKSVSGIYLKDDLYVEMDLRDFGYIYSEVDRAEQEESADLQWYSYQYAKESFGEATNKTMNIQLIEAYTGQHYYGDGKQATSVLLKNVDTFLIAVMAYLILIFVTLVFIGRFFRALKNEESPFGQYIIKNMQKTAFSLIPWGLIGPMIEVDGTKTASRISVLAGVNVATIFVIIVLLCLAYVFKYGALLQQESDETL